jgi:hypothetical protein
MSLSRAALYEAKSRRSSAVSRCVGSLSAVCHHGGHEVREGRENILKSGRVLARLSVLRVLRALSW